MNSAPFTPVSYRYIAGHGRYHEHLALCTEAHWSLRDTVVHTFTTFHSNSRFLEHFFVSCSSRVCEIATIETIVQKRKRIRIVIEEYKLNIRNQAHRFACQNNVHSTTIKLIRVLLESFMNRPFNLKRGKKENQFVNP